MDERDILDRRFKDGFITKNEHDSAMLALREAPAATTTSDPRPTRLRALFDRIGALPDDVLQRVEWAIAEAASPCQPHRWRGSFQGNGSARLCCPRCGDKIEVDTFAFDEASERLVGAVCDMPAADRIASALGLSPLGLRVFDRLLRRRNARRTDLDRMADAIHALPAAPTLGRAIGAAD